MIAIANLILRNSRKELTISVDRINGRKLLIIVTIGLKVSSHLPSALSPQPSALYLYPSLCTLFIALPDGSFKLLNDESHARASGVLQATDGTDGTHEAAESDGKCSEKIDL